MADPETPGAADRVHPGRPSGRVCVGKIGAAHGVRGEVRLWSFTQDPAAIASYGAMTTQGGQVIEIAGMRQQGEFFVARLKGVSDRNAAEALRNVELYVDRAQLPAIADPDEFYLADLIGLAAVDAEGRTIGRVLAVHNFGAGDMLELRLESEADTRMLAFTAATVPEVDIAAGRMVVAFPAEIEGDEGRGDTREGVA